MTIEHNKTLALRWSQELWGQGNLAVADEIIAPDPAPRSGRPVPGARPGGRQANRHHAANDAARLPHQRGSGDRGGRYRRQPLYGNRDGHRRLHEHAADRIWAP